MIPVINYQVLNDPRLQDCIGPDLTTEINNLHWMVRWSGQAYFNTMRGIDNLAIPGQPLAEKFQFDLVKNFDPNFSMSWSDITDLKAQELLRLSREQNKKIGVGWSGGIDSNVILVALLKNAQPEDLSRIVCVTTKSAVWENPYLFYTFIAPNVAVIDYDVFINSRTVENIDQYLYVHGMPADQLQGGIANSTVGLFKDSSYARVPWKDTSRLQTYLEMFIKDQDIVKWLIYKVGENIESVDIPITSCFNFVWWMNFNFNWSGNVTWDYNVYHANKNRIPCSTWLPNAFFWFADHRYQKWAMLAHQDLSILYGKNFDTWKLPSKTYIHEYTKDHYQINYKTKQGSYGRQTHPGTARRWFGVMPNDRILTLENDLEEIKDLLPKTVNKSAVNV
jgi:hypothetical protein